MNQSSRRTFLKHASLLFAGAVATYSFGFKARKPKLAFSTLGCPDWPFAKITDFAVKHGYHGIEVRGIQRQMDLVKAAPFNSPQKRKDTLRLMQDKGLQFVGLGSSANMHIADAALRKQNLDEARRFIDLAQDIECPFVRVFPNNFPKDQERNATISLITEGLLELADYSKGSRVSVLMETHGDLVRADDLLEIMDGVRHQHTGLVWDIANMWTITKEPPAEVYQKLKPYIRHTHIKDANVVDGKPQYALMGQGQVPVFEAIDALIKDNYSGYYSFEWEKMWHPGIAEPEVALAHFPEAMQRHLKKR